MQFFARRTECRHIVWAGPLVNTGATLRVAEDLRGRSCPTCGKAVRTVEFLALEGQNATFDEPPAPRNARNMLKKATNAEARKTERHLARLGGETGGLAAQLKEAAIELTPRDWRGSLTKIPVGILQTYEPNAECIRFKDSPVPAIVFHQGLAGFLFKMNRSIFPLVRLGTLGGTTSSFIDDAKTRSALLLQAVDTALEFLGVGGPRDKALVEIPLVVKAMEMPLTRTMSSFVLCHEYGHAVLNHADELRSFGGDPKSFLLERTKAMEHEADAWGQDALIGAFTGGSRLEPSLDVLDELFVSDATLMKHDMALSAPCIALLYFEFLDVVEDLLTRHGVDCAAQASSADHYRWRARMAESGAPSTHPSNKDRFQVLYQHLSAHGNFTAHSWVESFEFHLDEIKSDLDRLIDKTKAVRHKRLSRRFQLRRKANRDSNAWRDTIAEIDDDTRIDLEHAFEDLDASGPRMQLDEGEVQRRFEYLKEKAEGHLDRNEYAKAEKAYAQLLDLGETTESVTMYAALAWCREQLGDLDGAIAANRRCVELVPDSSVGALAAFSLGRMLLFAKDDLDGAEAALDLGLRSDIVDVRLKCMFWLGMIAQRRGDPGTALQRYREIYRQRDTELTMFPGVPGLAALNIGGIHQGRGEYTKAARMFEYARDHLRDDPENRAIAEQRLQRVRR
jgi:tetratricopeptide (TPR) repeat protein